MRTTRTLRIVALALLCGTPLFAAEIVVWHAYRAEEKAALEKVIGRVQRGPRREGEQGDDACRPL